MAYGRNNMRNTPTTAAPSSKIPTTKTKTPTKNNVPAFGGDTSGISNAPADPSIFMRPAGAGGPPPPGAPPPPDGGKPPPGYTDAIALWEAKKAEDAARLADNTIPAPGQVLRDIQGVQDRATKAGTTTKAATGTQAAGLFDRAQQPIYGAPSITQPGGMGGAAGTVASGPTSNVAGGQGPGGVWDVSSVYGGGAAQAKAPPPAPPAFTVGQQLNRGNLTAAPGSVASQFDPNVRDVGPAQSVAGTFGADPSQSVQRPQDVAGRLGGAPTIGNVADIRMGAAPGGIAGQLGTMGQSNAGQAGMLGRIESFLDGPEGPSVAEAQLRQSQADNMGNLMSAARSGRGGAASQVDAMRGAISEGGAIASDTAGQMATLRAQEQDMLKNRQLSAMGLGGDLATQQRAGDLSYRGQDLGALQGDQATALGARGQDLSASQSNQATQLGLQDLSATTALGARGQDLSALQGDQSTALGFEDLRGQLGLGARGQDLTAAMSDADRALAVDQMGIDRDMGMAGLDLSALQGDQTTALGARGQDNDRDISMRGQDVQTRDQDRQALTDDANRAMDAQDLNLRRELGLTDLGLAAQGQGLDYDTAMQGLGLSAEGMSTDFVSDALDRNVQLSLGNQAVDAQFQLQANEHANEPEWYDPEFWLPGVLRTGGELGAAGIKASDERAKTDIAPLDKLESYADSPANDLVRESPGYSYKYKAGIGEDPDVEHWGPMAQDLEKSPIGRSLVTERNGVKHVDVGRLALTHHAALHSMRNELDALRKYLEEDAA